MPYERDLDVRLYEKVWEDEGSRLTVSIQQYNKGTKKLQISRETKSAQDEYKFAKLGRLTKSELEAILPYLQEAATMMD